MRWKRERNMVCIYIISQYIYIYIYIQRCVTDYFYNQLLQTRHTCIWLMYVEKVKTKAKTKNRKEERERGSACVSQRPRKKKEKNGRKLKEMKVEERHHNEKARKKTN